MAFEGEQDAIGHPQSAEDPPSGKQPDLARSEDRVGNFADAVIVKNKTVEHAHHSIARREADRERGVTAS